MADIERLTEFIRAAKQKELGDEFTVALLRQQGWPDQRIYQAFTVYYEEILGQAIPSRGSRIEGAREAFLYLLAFITLGFWIVALILLADQLINHMFPSPLGTSYYSRPEIAGQLATLIVAFPLFLFVNWLIVKEVERRPEALESGVRKWLTYIALVITAVTLLGDAVAVITSFLSGDLTVRFLLEALVLFLITGGVFWYYLGAVRAEEMNRSRNRAFAWAAVALVSALVILGFIQSGSPARQRAIAVDDRRVGRLARIATALYNQVTNVPTKNLKRLPRTLDQIPSLSADEYKDPATGSPFEYHAANGTKYQVCAVFDADSSSQTIPAAWAHPAGRYCYDLDAAARPVEYYRT
ncbi:MAG: DUF5671 domain-containing protein [Candidatus Eremiobacteraeota bacterium]|nr:DUF5671 domain-containing protein [Candidatus Eremiobacteraeota bacterium]